MSLHPPPASPDEYWMQEAILLAEQAAQAGEVPVGAVVVFEGRIIGTGYNRPIALHDPSAHAEVIALRDAARQQQNYRLNGCELYVTLEPCLMCAGAMMHARLARVIFGAFDYKTGVCGSLFNIFDNLSLNHHTQVTGGVLQPQCSAQISQFFAQRRAQKRKPDTCC